MRSRKYWQSRAAARMHDYQRQADGAADAIAEAYQRASVTITQEMTKILRAFEASCGMTESEAQQWLDGLPDDALQGKLTDIAKYIRDPDKRAELRRLLSASAYRYRLERFEALRQDIDRQMAALAVFEQDAIRSHAVSLAYDAYHHTIFDIQQGTGLFFSFARMPIGRVQEILRNNWSGKLFSERVWGNVAQLNRALQRALLTQLMTGRSYRKTAREIEEEMASGAMEARRLVRTESTYVANMSELEGYRACGIKQYQFVATLDMRTSEMCAAMDGKQFDADQAEPGVNLPPLHPWCRSTTIAVIDGAVTKALKRRAKNPKTGEYEEIPADMTYGEWKKRMDEKYGTGTWEIERKKAINKMRDEEQFARYQRIIGTKNMPSSLAKFQDWKYNKSEEWNKLMRNKKLFEKIDNTESYSAEYKTKLKETYQYFKDNGYEFTAHGLGRIVGQKKSNGKRTFTNEEALEILKSPVNYLQEDGRTVKFYHEIAIVQAPDTQEVISVVVLKKPKASWKELS